MKVTLCAALVLAATAVEGPCDIYGAANTPCVAAHSTVRALYGSYSGNLYQIMRASDKATKDIPVLAPGGFANSAVQDMFCQGGRIYDQSQQKNHLDTAPPGGYCHEHDTGTDATAEKLIVGGHPVYSAHFKAGNGYRNDKTSGVAVNDEPETIYMVTSGKHYNNGCCFDHGNAETDNNDDGAGTMEAVYFGNANGGLNHGGAGPGPWIMADMEDALWGADVVNSNEPTIDHDFVTAMIKGDVTTPAPAPGPGPYQEGVDYSNNDVAPCDVDGCVLPTGSTHLDCEKTCKGAAGCVGYVFAAESCSGKSGSTCWTKGVMAGPGSPASCRNSRILTPVLGPGPYREGTDYGGYDIAPCGASGCVLSKGSTHLQCENTCKGAAGCVGYVFADEDCSGTSGPICWTKGVMGGPGSQASCRNSRILKQVAESGNWAIKGGNAQTGKLRVYWDGKRAPGYAPMKKQGAIILGIGGDNSCSAVGTFYEGVMTKGYTTDAADDAVQANIVAAGYKNMSAVGARFLV